MQAVQDIVQARGYDSVAAMDVGDHVEITPDSDGQMPLVIEKLSDDRIAVAHYYTQHGDIMYDPEIVFHIDNGVWTAVEYTQHPHIYQHDETGLVDAYDFAVNTWDDNLRKQGYVAAAHQQEGGGQ